MFTINLNRESAAVLLRCLKYGQIAVSQSEVDSGLGRIIDGNINLIRKQVSGELSKQILSETLAEKQTDAQRSEPTK